MRRLLFELSEVSVILAERFRKWVSTMSARMRIFGCLLLLVFSLPVLHAQVVNATLTKIRNGPHGAAVAGVKVTAINTGTNIPHEAISDSEAYITIHPSRLEDTGWKPRSPGFKKQVISGIVLQVADQARVNVTLQVGEVSESVSVVAVAPLVNSENATVGSVITEKRVMDLPLNGRNFMQLTLLSGGIVEAGTSNARAAF